MIRGKAEIKVHSITKLKNDSSNLHATITVDGNINHNFWITFKDHQLINVDVSDAYYNETRPNTEEEVYLITQEGKYLKTYNEFNCIEETDDSNEAQLFTCGDSDVDLYKDEYGWAWKDEPLLALNEDDFATYYNIIECNNNLNDRNILELQTQTNGIKEVLKREYEEEGYFTQYSHEIDEILDRRSDVVKFNIGDSVIVKEVETDAEIGGFFFTEEMGKEIGGTHVISKVTEYADDFYELEGDNYYYAYHYSWLDKE